MRKLLLVDIPVERIETRGKILNNIRNGGFTGTRFAEEIDDVLVVHIRNSISAIMTV